MDRHFFHCLAAISLGLLFPGLAGHASEERIALPHPKTVLGHVVSDDGQWLATAGKDHTVRIWNVPQRKLWSQHSTQWMGRPMRFHGAGNQQSLSIRECRMVQHPALNGAFVSDDHLLMIDLATRKASPRTVGTGSHRYLEAISPDGKWAIMPRYNAAYEHLGFDVWDVATAQKHCELADSAGGDHGVFSHDGTQFAAAIKWRPETKAVAASLNSWLTTSWSDPNAVQQPVRTIPAFNGDTRDADIRDIKRIEFSRDNRWLGVGGVSRGHREEAPDIVRFFDRETGEQRLTKEQARCLAERLSELHFSADGRYFVASCRERSTTIIHDHCPKLAVWDTATGNKVLELKNGGFLSPRISPDGSFLASIVRNKDKSDTLTIWTLADAKPIQSFPIADLSEYFEFGRPPGYGQAFAWPDTALSFTPDGKWLIVTAPLPRGDEAHKMDFATMFDVGAWDQK